jgi:hypothetical protein
VAGVKGEEIVPPQSAIVKMKKPYLISISSYAPELDNYTKSLSNLGGSVEPVSVNLESYPGHLLRWDFMPKELDRERMFIFTDSFDVIFQKPIPNLSPDYIYVADEGEIFKNNGFWRSKMKKYTQFDSLYDKPIYNIGSFACSGKLMDSFVKFLQTLRVGFKLGSTDQLLFNLWLHKPENSVMLKELPDLFTSIYANLEKGITVINEKKQFVNKNGELYSVVHFNGGTKNVFKEINSRGTS